MNKLLLSLVAAVLLVTNSFAQVAPSFKYQGVARNAANAPLVNPNKKKAGPTLNGGPKCTPKQNANPVIQTTNRKALS